MFEGLVRQLLLGYLGRYVKDIKKQHLKITVWNEEVLLRNVELILEAFDYLQLPFGLKQGLVGKLSIKIPWKKLGWDPIVIFIEDVFICACRREDQEWGRGAVERRELAAKKAKLATAELAKLSRRVCDNQAGGSFISYITAKILDSIQVSIKNVHVLYCDRQSEQAQVLFGLRFSSLTITKQNSIGISNGKPRGGQVSKFVEVLALGVYYRTLDCSPDLSSTDLALESKFRMDIGSEGSKYKYILEPFDVSVSLLMNRSGKLENDGPQYSIYAELTGLVMVLDEIQLQQILMIWDYLGTCQMREKYGRYRPWGKPISEKVKGWQTAWWHYAQESVLSDVRKKNKKTSWRYLGQRLIYRQKYVSLYKKKLEFLRREQPINEHVSWELEQMEKESDIEDILSYRSTAENEVEETEKNSSPFNMGSTGVDSAVGKQNDEHSSNRSRGWLKWISRGMLGAGGTEDSSQFSGVVSDDVIKDIYEATKFNPESASGIDAAANDKLFLSSIKFCVPQVRATLRSMKFGQEIAELTFEGLIIECNLWQDFASVSALLNSVQMACPCNNNVILHSKKVDKYASGKGEPSISIQVDVSPLNQEVGYLPKVVVQPLEVIWDSEFLSKIIGFYSLFESFKFHHERVLSSLDRIVNVKARLLSKAEYIFLSRSKVIWDVSLIGIVVNIPWSSEDSKQYKMVLGSGGIFISSRTEPGSFASFAEDDILGSVSPSDFSVCFQLNDLYDHFEVKLNDLEVKLLMPQYPQTMPVVEKFCSHIALASCIIQDESILKQLQVYAVASSLHVCCSPSICGGILGLISHIKFCISKSEPWITPAVDLLNLIPSPKFLSLSLVANLQSAFISVDLLDDGENNSIIQVALQGLDIRYALLNSETCRICLKGLKIFTKPLNIEVDGHLLCMSGNPSASHYHDVATKNCSHCSCLGDKSSSVDGVFLLHYESCRKLDSVCHKCIVYLNDVDLHCYPYIIGLMAGFRDRIPECGASCVGENSFCPMKVSEHSSLPSFAFQRLACTNFIELGSLGNLESIPLDRFPFVTIYNHGSLGNLESVRIHDIHRREEKFRNSKVIIKKESKFFHTSQCRDSNSEDEYPLTGSSCGSDLVSLGLNLTRVRIQFHDSSCIIGTLMLPTVNSLLSFQHGNIDVLCSAEGSTLSSSWWNYNIQDFLWGPLSPNHSPIINIHLRKLSGSQLGLSFSFQHVSCILPPEFLAIIIGYFSLPYWSCNSNAQPASDAHSHLEIVNCTNIFKFEILDSALHVPVGSNDCQFLKLEIPQVYCSFIESCSVDILKDIPPDCWVPAKKIGEKVHCLNIFGRELSLYLLVPDDAYDATIFDDGMKRQNISLIAPLFADIWVRIPFENEASCSSDSVSTCIMARIFDSVFFLEDGCMFDASDSLLDVINQFILVVEDSNYFTTDILQFFHLKKCVREKGAVPFHASSTNFTEVKCRGNSLAMKLCRTRGDSSFEQVAQVDMCFTCSASLENEIPLSLDASFFSLGISSFINFVRLAKCTSASSSSVLNIHLSKSDNGGNDLCFVLPSLDIWFHRLDWVELIDLISSFIRHYGGPFVLDASSKNYVSSPIDTNVGSKVIHQDPIFNLMSENIGLTLHLPIWVSEEAFDNVSKTATHEQRPQIFFSDLVEGRNCKCVTVTLNCRSEVVISSKSVRFRSHVKEANGTVVIHEGKNTHSWPFFQLSHIDADIDISDDRVVPVRIKADIQVDSLDVWLSHQLLFFWHEITFDTLEAADSQFLFGIMLLEVQLKKVVVLLTDGRWSCSGPLLEVLSRNLMLHVSLTAADMEGSVQGELQVNYNNIDKVLWEPFVEPCVFQLTMVRKYGRSGLLSNGVMTDIFLESTAQLNVNFTESLIEAIFRAIEIFKDAWGCMGASDLSESQRFLNYQNDENDCAEKYAPYILQNLTSLPLVFHICQVVDNSGNYEISKLRDGNLVQPGSSFAIHVEETPEQQLFRFRPSHSSDRLNEKQLNGVAHHYMSVQIDGTSSPSRCISMDLVGLTYFEVDFSKASYEKRPVNQEPTSNHVIIEEKTEVNGGFIVPVVFDVSVQRYSKLLRLYSTVILLNATSAPFELRFDIPFGVSPKILDPIYPGQEFPLPLHLAETGRMRWRPYGNTHLWSEVHNISDILSQENKIGFLRSFVCYPSHPTCDPFRFCISVEAICLPSSDMLKKGISKTKSAVNGLTDGSCCKINNQDKTRKRFVHYVTLSAPFVVKNSLPEGLSLAIENGGINRCAQLSEGETSFFHVDSSHDLGMEFHINGFKPSRLDFPRSETFSAMTKFSGTKFYVSETMSFTSDLCPDGAVHVIAEKIMDAFSGARELCLYVPFLLYNCTGFSLTVSASTDEIENSSCTIPSCYNFDEKEVLDGKYGLSSLCSHEESYFTVSQGDNIKNLFCSSHVVSTRKTANPHFRTFAAEPSSSSPGNIVKQDFNAQVAFSDNLSRRLETIIPMKVKASDAENECVKVKPCMYSPIPNSLSSGIMVRVGRCQGRNECVKEGMPKYFWSNCFPLVPPTGSISVLVPQPSKNAAHIISVTSSALPGQFFEKTKAITFQPRYVISNACSKSLSFKQKGTDFVFQLGIGKHSELQWMDTTRDLLVSVCFSEPGWDWSGCFLPEDLGDTQVKMRNYDSGSVSMIRVEVQNAGVSTGDETIVGSPHGISGTNLVLLSDDDTGFMPYRIDNFSKERLRVYQQKCETFATIIHPYTSCPYAWDEPCYPHQLIVEVPGERSVGCYSIDDVREYKPVTLSSTSEKPGRTLLFSVHAEGAMKVLNIIDSSYHIFKDVKDQSTPWFQDNKNHDKKRDGFGDYTENIAISIPFIGISLISSCQQELLFASAKNTTVDFCQTLDQRKFSFRISSLQIDNQLRSAVYPVILSFDHQCRSNPAIQMKTMDDGLKIKDESLMHISSDPYFEPVFCLSAAMWRNKDASFVSFQYIRFRVADFHLELEQEMILSFFDLLRTVSTRFQSRVSCYMDSKLGFQKEYTTDAQNCDYVKVNVDPLHVLEPIENKKSEYSIPLAVPIGGPWQKIYLLARRQKKIYVEVFDLAPINLTLSFSSTPWLLTNGILTSRESLLHRGLMALADVEGAQIHLKQLSIGHHMASFESIQQILIRHYSRQLLHEMYKVFGSAGVIGNPMGFARSLGLGIKDFLSVPARSVLQSPTGIITGMAQGTTSLLSNTVYAISDAATQFSRAAHKGIVAFTFDDQDAAQVEKQQKGVASKSKGVINELLEGLTGLLHSPIRGAEKHGLPGVFSGIALGVTGLVARPAASILEVTGKTAQSIRNRSKLYQIRSQHLRVRLPRPLSRELPLRPYSWEEAVGTSVLAEAGDGLKFKDETLVICKALKQSGKFVIITERLIIVSSSSLVGLGSSEFKGVAADPEWGIELDSALENVIHVDAEEGIVHIVGSNSEDALLRQNQIQQRRGGGTRSKRWYNNPTEMPLFQTNLEFAVAGEAQNFLQVLLSTVKLGKECGWGSPSLLHQRAVK